MHLAKENGRLVVIGGAEDHEGEQVILKRFVEMCGGSNARIAVMTIATEHPDEVGARYIKVFKRLGVKEVDTVDVRLRADAGDKEALDTLQEATGIFFTGGDQLHITALVGGSPMDDLLHKRYEAGVILAGTSAGAAMMSNSMIIGGASNENPRVGCVIMASGMEFLLGGVVDTHFSQRGRHGRLLTAVAHHPHDMGIGLDEDTAIIVEGSEFEVLGSGACTFIDVGGISYTNLLEIHTKDSLSLHDVRLHVLPAGHRFDLAARRPIIPNESGQRRESIVRKSNGGDGEKAASRSKTKSGTAKRSSARNGKS